MNPAADNGLTASEISRPSRRMSRPKNEHEPVLIRFRPGTMDRIDTVLLQPETRADFVRQAVEDALKKRARSTPKTKPTPNPPSPSQEGG